MKREETAPMQLAVLVPEPVPREAGEGSGRGRAFSGGSRVIKRNNAGGAQIPQ